MEKKRIKSTRRACDYLYNLAAISFLVFIVAKQYLLCVNASTNATSSWFRSDEWKILVNTGRESPHNVEFLNKRVSIGKWINFLFLRCNNLKLPG